MAKKRRRGTCGLCGKETEVTREHFVPQCLWSGAMPNRIETVPACDDCNAATNLDDEYFRNCIVMMFDLDHPQKQELFKGPVLRSFARQPGRAKAALADSTISPLFTPSGLWVGDFPTLSLDVDRLNRSLFKVIKGLYCLIRKQAFPADGQIGLIGEYVAETKPLIELIEEHLFPATFDFGDDVFEWRFCQTETGITMWKIAFYRSVVFYAYGVEKREMLDELNAAIEAKE